MSRFVIAWLDSLFVACAVTVGVSTCIGIVDAVVTTRDWMAARKVHHLNCANHECSDYNPDYYNTHDFTQPSCSKHD